MKWLPKGRAYEPRGLTLQEKRDKASVRGKCRRNSRQRYCRLVRCIRTVEASKRKVKSPVAVCRSSIYGKR